MSARYISLVEEVKLAAAGAKKRMERAQQVLADFHLEHDGQGISPELRQSLEREQAMLDIELDEAARQYAKAVSECAELANIGNKKTSGTERSDAVR